MRYLVSVIGEQTDAPEPTSAETAASLAAFNDRLEADGHWVFSGGLGEPSTATVVDNRGDGEPIVTDGPYLETKEYLAGFWIWEAPDLDVAVRLAADASKACNGKVEVRPILSRPGTE